MSMRVAVLMLLGSDLTFDSTPRLADILVQHRVSSHHQLVCMMASHAVASWSHHHFGTKSSFEKLHELFTRKAARARVCLANI